MKCPFEKERKEGTMVCDFMGMKPIDGLKQCPTEIFNYCQMDDESDQST